MLKTRIITGIVLAILGFLLVFCLHGKYFDIVLALILAVGATEWMGFLGIKKLGYLVIYALVYLLLCYVAYRFQVITICVGAVFWVLGLVSLFVSRRFIPQFLKLVPGVVIGYLVLVPSYIAAVRIHEISPWVLLYAVFVVAGSDIGAYFAGRACGKHKLAEKISPKKTWEGFAGGIVVGVIISIIMSVWIVFPHQDHYLVLTGVSILLVIFGVVGDLFESQFKRAANIKDSGKILPGHGGILDRFDSHLAALPILAFILMALGL